MQMMFKQAKLKMGYVEEVHAQVLELPYVEGVLGMLILLPDDNTDLAVVSPLAMSLSVHGSRLSSFLKVHPPDSI